MFPPFCKFYKNVVQRLSEHGDVIETQTIKVCPPKVFWQTRSLVVAQEELGRTSVHTRHHKEG